MNCNTTHYRANSSSVPGDPTAATIKALLSGGGTEAAPFQLGGPVRGRPGVDRVPIRATVGEFIVKVAAVKHWGLGALHAINNMQWPFPQFDLPRFEMGGVVGPMFGSRDGAMAPAFAGVPIPIPATLAGPQRQVAVDLRTDFGDFSLHADKVVADALDRISSSKAMRRAGRSPGWRGN